MSHAKLAESKPINATTEGRSPVPLSQRDASERPATG